ncbi:MAG: hypothetical protein HON76_07125 [Candidatus Scalindua sp.]|jgi:hypothetical protein|nr:hypothetical protein [Candidatus Scalindua sp.]MBT5306267.1 hypothetical protein [Candidatus Scalindua sp.]MBT6053720.1 hypothetical protein [Candidatus Scalindua sp.]MBT6562281.1 hypothetical protein [Candidatus Scalindua sp.]MBT7212562.1 hypothetical protein [Candidatus Scalindua sp.]
MKNLTIGLTVIFLLAFMSTAVFAANGNKGDWGFDPKYYKYALIEGEITSVDHEKMTLHVKGKDEQIFFCEHTEFFRGDISLPMEIVFHPVKFNDNQKMEVVDVKAGDIIKSRYSKVENGKIYLDTCLVEERSKLPKSIDINNETTL